MTSQVNFFDIVDVEVEPVQETFSDPQGVVFQIEPDKWQAQIGAGWWVAYGTTKSAAIKSVKKIYYKEIER